MNIKDLYSLDPELRAKLALAMRRDYEVFAKVIFDFPNKSPKFHSDIYQALNKRLPFNAFILFRGGSKSTISKTVQVTADLCHHREAYTGLLSESLDQAVKDLDTVKMALEGNEKIHALYGSLMGTTWKGGEITTTHNDMVKCFGANSRIRGTKSSTSSRFTKVILDDYESEDNTATAKQREAVNSWLNKKVLPAGIPNVTTVQYYGTIVHPEAHLNKIRNYQNFKAPHGIYMEIPVEKDGVSAWEDRFPIEYIEQLRRTAIDEGALSAFLQEYYHIPAGVGKPVFDVSMLREVDFTFDKGQGITWLRTGSTKVHCNVFIGVDPAISLKDGSDNSVICVLAMLPDKTYVILEVIVDKLTPTQQRDTIHKLVTRYDPVAVTIETNGYQGALEDMCKELMSKTGMFYSIRDFMEKF